MLLPQYRSGRWSPAECQAHWEVFPALLFHTTRFRTVARNRIHSRKPKQIQTHHDRKVEHLQKLFAAGKLHLEELQSTDEGCVRGVRMFFFKKRLACKARALYRVRVKQQQARTILLPPASADVAEENKQTVVTAIGPDMPMLVANCTEAPASSAALQEGVDAGHEGLRSSEEYDDQSFSSKQHWQNRERAVQHTWGMLFVRQKQGISDEGGLMANGVDDEVDQDEDAILGDDVALDAIFTMVAEQHNQSDD